MGSATYFSFIYYRYAIVQAHSVWENMLVVNSISIHLYLLKNCESKGCCRGCSYRDPGRVVKKNQDHRKVG